MADAVASKRNGKGLSRAVKGRFIEIVAFFFFFFLFFYFSFHFQRQGFWLSC